VELFQDNSGSFYCLEEATKSGSVIKYRDRKGIIYETGIKEKVIKKVGSCWLEGVSVYHQTP
jgi:hypothetical protein